jgi:signal transduction histidine kinase
LFAQHSAVILQNAALLAEAARLQAREETVRLKEDFLSAAAHELKTPLTALVGQAQLLERQARRQPAAPVNRSGLDRMLEQAHRLTVLVHRLLEGAHIERQPLDLDRRPLDLVELARGVGSRQSTERHPCLVEADVPIIGAFDQPRLEQVLDNLIENAIKFSPWGGPVRLRIWQVDQMAHLEVIDQGIGIPAADLPRLFERFHRGSNVDDRRFAGLGLGLYLCRSIVEEHGGRLWATSPGAGKGSSFHVELPLAPPATATPAVGASDGPGVAASAPEHGGR